MIAGLRSDYRTDKPGRFDRQHGTINLVQDALRGIAHEETGNAGPRDGSHDDEIDIKAQCPLFSTYGICQRLLARRRFSLDQVHHRGDQHPDQHDSYWQEGQGESC